jgi:hypothetical protein
LHDIVRVSMEKTRVFYSKPFLPVTIALFPTSLGTTSSEDEKLALVSLEESCALGLNSMSAPKVRSHL